MLVSKEKNSQGLRVALELPDQPLTPEDSIPHLQLDLKLLEVGGYRVGAYGLSGATVRTGIYLAEHPETIIENKSWFVPGNILRLVRGDYAKHGWYPYAFLVAPTTLRVDYYNAWEPKKCGMFELGKNISRLYMDFSVPRDKKVRASLEFDGGVVSELRQALRVPVPEKPFWGWSLAIIRSTEMRSGWRGWLGQRYTHGLCRANCYLEAAGVGDPIYEVILRGADYDPNHCNEPGYSVPLGDGAKVDPPVDGD